MTDHPYGRGAPGDAGWIILRDDLEVVAADDVARALLGTPQPDALTGRSLTSLVAVSDGASLESVRAAAASGRPWEGRLRFTTTLTPVELDASLTPAPQGGMALLQVSLPRYAAQAAAPAGDPALRARLDAHEALLEVTPDAPAARAVLQALRQVVPFDWAAVLRFTDGAEGRADGRPGAEIVGVYPSAMAGMAPGVRWSPLTPDEARVREDGEPSLTNDLPAAGRSPLGRLGAFGMRSRLLIPLYAGDRVAGCVAAYLHGPAIFSPQDGIHAEATLRPLGARIAAPAAEVEAARPPATQPAPAPVSPGPPRPVAPVPPPLAVPPVDAPPVPAPRVTSDPAPRLGLLSELVAGVAHELNNPLTSILGYAQILSTLEGAEREEAIETIETEAARASRIVRNLLSFARQRPAERYPIDLERIIRRVIDIRRYALEMDDIRVIPRFGHVPDVQADESQFEDVFLHLLNNAQQALQNRGGEITITTATVDDRVIITFGDNGPGIPDDVRARIFEPFFTTREVGAGEGMGLSIVYGVVTGHGGRTWVESGPNGGTQVVMELPAARPLLSADTVTPVTAGTRILVVDDEAPIRALTQEILAAAGYAVTTAANGIEAVRALESAPFDLIVADVRMPGMGGAGLYDVVRQRWPELATHMLMVSGDIEGDQDGQALREHVRYLEKPFDTRELLGAISALLEMRHTNSRGSA